MKIERETVEHLDRLLCATPSMGGYFEVPEDMRPVIEELTRTWLALDAAPVARIGNSDAFSCFLEKPQGSEAGPVHAMLGQRVRLVPTHSAGGE